MNRFAIKEENHFEIYDVHQIRIWWKYNHGVKFNKEVIRNAVQKYANQSRKGIPVNRE